MKSTGFNPKKHGFHFNNTFENHRFIGPLHIESACSQRWTTPAPWRRFPSTSRFDRVRHKRRSQGERTSCDLHCYFPFVRPLLPPLRSRFRRRHVPWPSRRTEAPDTPSGSAGPLAG